MLFGSINKDHFQSHIRKLADKKTAYNEVRLYINTRDQWFFNHLIQMQSFF
jgi:hypothetical protein